MTPTHPIACRLHPTTGRLTCRYRTTGARTSADPSYGSIPDPDRSRRESVRRARRRVDELVHDFDLRMLWTLSFATARHDYADVASTLPPFSRRLRAAGVLLPRLTVPEQSDRGRWHLHMAVPDFIAHSHLSEAWGHGFVGAPSLDSAVAPNALKLISSYLTKSFDRTPVGCRRYITTAGLRPTAVHFTAPDEAAALAIATQRLGRNPLRTTHYAGNLLAVYPCAPAGTA